MSDWITPSTGVGALLVSIVALGVAFKTRGDSNRSATATEAGAAESKRSADAAERSAEDAKRSADAAEETARLERAARHDLYAPARMPAVPTRLQAASHAGGSLFGEITVQRDYRVTATGRYGTGGAHGILYSRLIRAGVPQSFPIETWPPGRDTPETVEIEFQFWPPAPQDDAEPWTCPCGKAADDPAGHWRFVVPVAAPPAAPAGRSSGPQRLR